MVEQEEQEQVEPEENAKTVVLILLSLTCGERKYRLYLNLIKEKSWINQKVLEQTIRELNKTSKPMEYIRQIKIIMLFIHLFPLLIEQII